MNKVLWALALVSLIPVAMMVLAAVIAWVIHITLERVE